MKYIRHDEVFDRPYNFRVLTSPESDEWVAGFHTDDGREAFVSFDKIGIPIVVTFRVEGKEEEITDRGDAFRIFATVIDVWREYLDVHPEVEVFEFAVSDESPSRIRLYERMLKRLASPFFRISVRKHIAGVIFMLKTR